VLVGHNTTSDPNVTGVMSLAGSGASSIGSANLVFNLNSNSPGAGNELSVGATAITFNTVGSLNTQMTLNIEGTSYIASHTGYVLVAGTGTTTIDGITGATSGQYSGLTVFTNSLGQEQIITGPTSNLQLAFADSTQANLYTPSYLFLNQAGGVDDIEVEVVPEPGTWAMMLAGLGLLIFWQRRKNRS
jgi:PEP-CTERM motif